MVLEAFVQDVKETYHRIAGQIVRTPVLPAPMLNEGKEYEVLLKAEHLQLTGSFKIRGALNKTAYLTDDELKVGIATVSAGNHAMAVAKAGAIRGVSTVVCMPETAPQVKIDGVRSYGGEVRLFPTTNDAFIAAKKLATEQGYAFLHPFDDIRVIHGQATVGLELIQQAPDVDVVVIGIGGGALCSGIATYLKAVAPHVRVFGVEPEGAKATSLSFASGKPEYIGKVDTIADGLGSPMAGDITFPLMKEHLTGLVVIDDATIKRGIKALLTEARQYVEPAGAAAYAAVQSGAVKVKPGEKVLCVCSGGNMDWSKTQEYVS